MFITGPVFDSLTDENHVHALATEVVDEFSAIIGLLWASLERPLVGKVLREDDDGKRKGFVFLSIDAVLADVKMRAQATAGDSGNAKERGPTQAQQLLAASRRDRHLQAAILLWADPLKTWTRLYRILEEIESSIGQCVD